MVHKSREGKSIIHPPINVVVAGAGNLHHSGGHVVRIMRLRHLPPCGKVTGFAPLMSLSWE